MSLDLLERAAAALGPLVDEVVFVGGTTVSLHVTESGGTSYRPTVDVDLVIEAVTRIEYELFAERLRSRGIGEDSSSGVICRWRQRDPELILDVMPVDGRMFGFGNRWYPDAIRTSVSLTLPSGRAIRICSAVALLATKLEAFADRGAADPMVSHDLEDIIRLIDGRPSLADEIEVADASIGDYIRGSIRALVDHAITRDSIPLLMLPDDGSQLRAAEIVIPRMRRIAQSS